MTLQEIWDAYLADGYDALHELYPAGAAGHIYLALLAYGAGEFEAAYEFARRAAEDEPGNLVFAEAADYLERVLLYGKAGVYVDGAAFEAFIRGGGNLALYEETSAALRAVYEQYPTLSVLDIGVGDGSALLPALTQNVTQVDLVEPSEVLLAKVVAALSARKLAHRAFPETAESAMQVVGGDWDVIQATYSLQSIPPKERQAVFAWIRERGKRLLIVEFDVPDYTAMYAPGRVEYVLERYQHGLAEYVDDDRLVAQGFLMPVMFGYFDPTAARTNYEQPIKQWVTDLETAGFGDVRSAKLHAYWWADAYLVDAR